MFSRVSQYVYVPTKDTYFSALDQHADTLEGDVKPPLVVLGDEGNRFCVVYFNCARNYYHTRERKDCTIC